MSERTELIIRAVGVVGKTDGTLYCGQVFYIGSGPATGTYRIESIETQESDPHSKIMGAAKELGWGIAIPHGEPESAILGYSIGTDEYLAAVDGNKANAMAREGPSRLDELRDALTAYANPENWTLDEDNLPVVWDGFEADPECADSGPALARKALGIEEAD